MINNQIVNAMFIYWLSKTNSFDFTWESRFTNHFFFLLPPSQIAIDKINMHTLYIKYFNLPYTQMTSCRIWHCTYSTHKWPLAIHGLTMAISSVGLTSLLRYDRFPHMALYLPYTQMTSCHTWPGTGYQQCMSDPAAGIEVFRYSLAHPANNFFCPCNEKCDKKFQSQYL